MLRRASDRGPCKKGRTASLYRLAPTTNADRPTCHHWRSESNPPHACTEPGWLPRPSPTARRFPQKKSAQTIGAHSSKGDSIADGRLISSSIYLLSHPLWSLHHPSRPIPRSMAHSMCRANALGLSFISPTPPYPSFVLPVRTWKKEMISFTALLSLHCLTTQTFFSLHACT